MVRVGYKMVRENPITGVGPGRVNELYTTYLSPQDPVLRTTVISTTILSRWPPNSGCRWWALPSC